MHCIYIYIYIYISHAHNIWSFTVTKENIDRVKVRNTNVIK